MNSGGQLAGAIKRAAQQLQTVDKLVEPMRQAAEKREREELKRRLREWGKEREESRRPQVDPETAEDAAELDRQSYESARANGGLFMQRGGQWVPER